MPLPFGDDGSDHLAGAAYDPATQRLFLTHYNAYNDAPIILVYQILNLPPVNHAPVLHPVGSQSFQAGTAITLTIGATDADGDVLEFSASTPEP
jgi:hypothetical protein